MSVALYIVLEKEIADFDVFVDGKAVGHAEEEVLEKICVDLGVPPLMVFFSQDPDELADFLDDELGEEAPEPDELPAEEWFDAAAGLVTVQTLADHLEAHPQAIENSAAIAEDLRDYQRVLERLKTEKVRWHFAMDF
ncbi:MAG: hypothetical protein Q8J78_12400 [Moraxellaceae bacterium]|nr:hypothetical protein [Moraxellaceae bacterium]